MGELKQGQSDFLSNPNYLATLPLANHIVNHPDIFTPEVVNALKANNQQDQQLAYNGAQSRTDERAASTGGFRGGAERFAERLNAVDLGNNIASGNRQIDIGAATGNRQSELGALGVGYNAAQIPYAMTQSIANAYLGQASNPVWQQQNNTLGPLFGGLGQIGASAAGAPAGGGFSG